MPKVEYNDYTPWIQKDDIVSPKPGLIEWKNVTWLETGYGITLWPKTTKQVLTSTNIIRWIYDRTVSWINTNLFMFWDWWVVYRWDSVDNTPFFTLPSWDDIHNVLFSPSNKYYMTIQTATDTYSIGRINADFLTWVDETIQTWLISPSVPPMLSDGSLLYIWVGSTIYTYDKSNVEVSYSLFQQHIVWITKHWTQFYVYSNNWTLTLWNWGSSVSANLDLGVNISRVVQKAWVDYLTSKSWDFYVMSWYTAVLISETKDSKRLDDNSQYTSKLKFKTGDEDNRTLESARDSIYLIANDTQPGIYQFTWLLPWMTPWHHKICTTDNTSTDVDYIYSLFYNENQNTLWFSYNRWGIFWVDKLEFDNKTTQKDWSFVTQIWRWPPNEVNKNKTIKITFSNTSWNNFIKLYKRIDNWSWELFRTFNRTNDTIHREKITNQNDRFIDEQIKVELHNDTQAEDAPIVHGFEIDYSVIEK